MPETIVANMQEAGITAYAIVQNATGHYLDPSDWTFKAFIAAGNHDIPLAADTNQPQVYSAALTTTNFGTTRNMHSIWAYKQAAGAPNLTNDVLRAASQVVWDGVRYAIDVANLVWDARMLSHVIEGSMGLAMVSPFCSVRGYAYNAAGLPTAFVVRFYDTEAHKDTDDGTTGLIRETHLSGITWDSSGNPVGTAKLGSD